MIAGLTVLPIRLRRFGAMCLLGCALWLSGCAATDVYPLNANRPVGSFTSDPSLNFGYPFVPPQTAAIGVPPIKIPQFSGRDGQIFHNALRDRLAPTGLPNAYAFELIGRSFSVTTSDVNDVLDSDQKLTRYRVSFSYRVNRIDVDGTRTLVFADSKTVDSDFNAPPDDGVFVVDARQLTSRRQAIEKMADHVHDGLRLQFARLNYDMGL